MSFQLTHPNSFPIPQAPPGTPEMLPIFKTANNGAASVSSGDTFQWLVKVENSLQSKQKLSLQP